MIKKKLSLELRNYRFIFFQIGLIIALLVPLLAFEIKLNVHPIPPEKVVELTIWSPVLPPLPPEPKIQIETKLEKVILNVINPLLNIKLVDHDIIQKVDSTFAELPEPAPVVKFMAKPAFMSKPKTDKIVENPDQNPYFDGGEEAFRAYLSRTVEYPQMAIEMEEEGTVNVLFVVDKKGRITNVTIANEEMSRACREEAIRAVEAMPNWNPGIMNGRPVKTRMQIPIEFRLY